MVKKFNIKSIKYDELEKVGIHILSKTAKKHLSGILQISKTAKKRRFQDRNSKVKYAQDILWIVYLR